MRIYSRIPYRGALELSVHTYREWHKDRTLRNGAALAYYGIFALVPYVVMVFVFALLFFSPQQIISSIQELSPNTVVDSRLNTIQIDDVTSPKNDSNESTESRSSQTIGLIGLGSFIVTATLFMVALQDVLNTIWKSRNRLRFSWRKYLLAFATMTLAVVIFSGVIALQVIIQVVKNFLPSDVFVLSVGVNIFTVIGLLAILTILFMMLTRLLIKVKIDTQTLFISSFIIAVLMYVGVYAVTLYVTNFTNFNYYGAVSSFLVALLALYYFAQVYLIGVQLGKVIAYRRGNQHLHKYLSETDPRNTGLPKWLARLG